MMRIFALAAVLVSVAVAAFVYVNLEVSSSNGDSADLRGPVIKGESEINPGLAERQIESADKPDFVGQSSVSKALPKNKSAAAAMWASKVENFWAAPQGVASYVAKTIESGPADSAMKAFYELRRCEYISNVLESYYKPQKEGRLNQVESDSRVAQIQSLRIIEQQCSAIQNGIEKSLDGLLRTALKGKADGAATEMLMRHDRDPLNEFSLEEIYSLVRRDAMNGDFNSITQLGVAAPSLSKIDEDEFRAIVHAFKDISTDEKLGFLSSNLQSIEEIINSGRGVPRFRQYPGRFSVADVPEPVTQKGIVLKAKLVAAISCKTTRESCPER